MNPVVQIEEDRPSILVGEKPWVRELGLSIPIRGQWHRDGEGFVGGKWVEQVGEDVHGRFHEWRRIFMLEGDPLILLVLREYAGAVLVQAELLQPISAIHTADSFEEPTFLAPTFSFTRDLKFFLTTFGLGPSTEGGYWPEAVIGKGPEELPKQAFAPLVLFSEEGAIAIAPGDWFLTSPMVRIPGGAARGLSGAVDHLPAGFTVSTWFIAGEDVPSALMRLGDLLLAQSEKTRPKDHLMLSTLGYWNAYGGYYSELLNPMNGKTMEELAAYFKRENIPVRYFGLDLWYRYEKISRAIRYKPDQRKYPEGLREIAARTGLPYVLHLSALSNKNEYNSDGSDPAIYRTIAREIKEEGGIAAWYDWLRTHQCLIPTLRDDPVRAEQWFSGMAEAFQREKLPLLLGMQTMGMALASTAKKNIIAGRTFTDYLFGQSKQLEELTSRGLFGFLRDRKPRQAFIRNNILVGMVLYGLGLLPFHDLFITNVNHSEGFGDELAEQEALLRALSCGPVGIGDKLGEIDKRIIARLAFPDGRLAQPDRPLLPLQESFGEDILVAWTETRLNEKLRWIYLVAFNVGDEEKSFQVNVERIFGKVHLIYDYFAGRFVPEVAGVLGPARARYYVLVPQVTGVGLLGLRDKFVTVPSGRLVDFQADKQAIQATLSLPPGVVYPVAAFSPDTGLAVAVDQGAKVIKVERMSDLHIAWIKPTQEVLSIHFRRLMREEKR